MKFAYYFGRALQILALAAMPLSIWVGHLGHNERGAVVIFVSSIIIFFLGWICSQIR